MSVPFHLKYPPIVLGCASLCHVGVAPIAKMPSPRVAEAAVVSECVLERRLWAVPEGAAQLPSPRQKVLEDADVPEFKCETPRLPVTSELDKSTAELVTACVLPAKCATPALGEDAVTQVVQVMVPVVVIVPPPMGEVVAMLVTPPPPPPLTAEYVPPLHQ